MQKGLIFVLIIWSSSPFASGNTATNHLQFSLGCQAVIPCQCYRSGSDSFKWFYKKDEHSDTIRIHFQDKTGMKYHQVFSHPRRSMVLHNFSLVIDNLTEDDQGLYWCENCFKGKCLDGQPTIISVKKEILKETNETVYVTAGSSFTPACPGELTNLKWTFKASDMAALRDSVQGPESRFVTFEPLHITNVKRADAGKYTCWTSECDGRWQKLLTINLCVITVHHNEDSSVSCAVMCDKEFSDIKPNSTSNVATDTRRVNVDSYGFLNCRTKHMLDGYSTANSTQGPSNALNQTTGTPTEPEYPILIYGTFAALTCLILMALLICYLKPRLQADFPIHLCCCGLNGRVEEETSVLYSSVIIRRPAETTNNHTTCNGCVYSEIQV